MLTSTETELIGLQLNHKLKVRSVSSLGFLGGEIAKTVVQPSRVKPAEPFDDGEFELTSHSPIRSLISSALNVSTKLSASALS